MGSSKHLVHLTDPSDRLGLRIFVIKGFGPAAATFDPTSDEDPCWYQKRNKLLSMKFSELDVQLHGLECFLVA